MAGREWFLPAGLLRRQVEHRAGPRRLSEHAAAECDGILPGCGGDLVDEALDHVVVVGDAHPSPPAGSDHRLLVADVLDADGRDVVEQLHRPVHRIPIQPVLESGRCPAGENGDPDDPVAPAHQLAAGIQPGGDPVVVVGAIHIVLDIFLAGPDDLDGALDLLGDTDRLGDVVVLQAPPEPTTQQVVVEHDLLQRQTGDLGRGRAGSALHLRAGPHLAAVLPHVDRAAQRLHGGMRQEGHLVDGLDHPRRPARVTLVPGHDWLLPRCCLQLLHHVIRRDPAIRSIVPANRERRQPLLGCPHVVGDHGDHLTQVDNLVHSLDRQRLFLIQPRHRAAQDRAGSDGGDLHPRHPHVDAIQRRPIDLGRRVEPLGRCTDEA